MEKLAPAIAPLPNLGTKRSQNQAVLDWVQSVARLTQPENIFWCDGSEKEHAYLLAEAEKQGVVLKLSDEKVPRSYLHRSNPNDVARVEQFTFICTPTKEEAGPTNNWSEPSETYQKLHQLLAGAMKGRTMFVVPYIMGPPDSPLTKVGFEITDSIYVVLSMRIMTRMGAVAVKRLGEDAKAEWNRGVHSLLDVNPERRFICHFPQDNTIISVGSGYGGNVLLSKKCLALRIGSYLARKQGWLAEHMLILGVESPAGRKHYVAAAFPSACGKTNFAMLIPPKHFAGWKVTTVGDDIAWMQIRDGRLWAVNPENGYFGVVPGTSYKSNPNAMRSIEHDTLYTNVALTDDGDVWWEGKDGAPPAHVIDWRGNDWTPQSKDKAAHPNSRFATPMQNNPVLDPEVENGGGVPISAIIFGGRRSDTLPLVFQARDWEHGTYVGATMGSETTAAAAGAVGQVRRDPMAMLPFCGYNMGDYFAHWLKVGATPGAKMPRIYFVNWFRKDDKGKFMWPGYGDNSRVLKWIFERCNGTANAVDTPIGRLPRPEDLDTHGLDIPAANLTKLLSVDMPGWLAEVPSINTFFEEFGARFPAALKEEVVRLEQRLRR
jgi:phosphoenolpyruvate carboxykinase (GTP)